MAKHYERKGQDSHSLKKDTQTIDDSMDNKVLTQLFLLLHELQDHNLMI